MPDGTTQAAQSALGYAAVVKRLQSKREVIQKLPIEKQLAVYGVAFDRFVKPTLSKSGVKEDKDFNVAKDRWISSIVDPKKNQPLPEDYGRPAATPGLVTKGSAALVGTIAGAEGAIKNILEFTDKVGNRISGKIADKPEADPWVRALSDAEAQDYALAHAAAPNYAATGAAVGKAIPSLELYEGAASMIPKLAAGTPMAYRLLSRMGRAAVGGAAGALPYDSDTKGIVQQAAVNTGVDLLFGGIGKVGSKGASKLINGFKTRGNPAQQQAATVVEDMLTSVIKERFGGKPLDKLSPEEFQAASVEARSRRAAGEAQQREAKKAVAAAQEAKKPTKEQQILAKQQAIVAKQVARKAENERAQAFHKRLIEYRKRTGTVPGEGTEHFNQLKSGKTVDEIIGTPEAQAVKSATQVADVHQAQALVEGAPTAVEAMKVVQGVAKTPKPKAEPLFKVNTDRLKAATTPEEFASAKKDTLSEIESQAREHAKTLPESQREKLSSEYIKARERVRSHPVPENISKKKLDANRKSSEVAAGTRDLTAAQELASSDPESDLAQAIDRSKELVKEWKSIGSDAGLDRISAAWRKVSPGADIKVLNDMLETAIEAMRKNK